MSRCAWELEAGAAASDQEQELRRQWQIADSDCGRITECTIEHTLYSRCGNEAVEYSREGVEILAKYKRQGIAHILISTTWHSARSALS